jgi:cytochrome P450
MNQTIPQHVGADRVYDFDMFADPAYLRDPHARIMELLAQTPPVFWTPRNGGHWMIAGHEAVFKASRDFASFSSQMLPAEQIQAMLAALPPGSPRMPQSVPINIDPPLHTKFRAPLNAVFAPKTILAMRDDIRALADELLDAIKPKGRCEFMTAVAEPLPVQVFLKMFGLPVQRQAQYRALVTRFMSSPMTDMAEIFGILRGICDVMHDTMMDRRDNPRNDIISTMWQTEIDGRAMTLDDIENFCVLLFLAGLDTVMNGIGHGVRHLAMDQDLQARLRANPGLIVEAAEELLRRYTFTVPTRLVARDLEFEGASMKQGERAYLFLPGADLDRDKFPEPDTFNMARANKVHIAFGAGPHRCVGSHLARIELQVLYAELLERLPEFRLDPGQEVRFRGGHVIGPRNLPLVWDL